MPSWRGQIQAQTNAMNPTFNVAPEMPRPNFSPTVTGAWTDPELRQNGTVETTVTGDPSAQAFRQITGDPSAAFGNVGKHQAPLYQRDQWANPLDALFGNISGQMPDGLSKQNSLGNQQIGVGDPRYGYTVRSGGPSGQELQYQMGNYSTVNQGQQMLDKHTGLPVNGQMPTPQNARDLYNSIGNLSLDQLMRLSSNGGVTSQFNMAAQNYANAYANPNYGKRLMGQTQVGGPGLDQATNSDYLQKSYESVMKRMNDNFLL